MRTLALSVIFILCFVVGLSAYYMNNAFFSTSGQVVRSTEAQLRDGCNLLKNAHNCDVGAVETINYVYVNNGNAETFKLYDLCQARGFDTPSQCATLCGCYQY
jgi:hypothetical protein